MTRYRNERRKPPHSLAVFLLLEDCLVDATTAVHRPDIVGCMQHWADDVLRWMSVSVYHRPTGIQVPLTEKGVKDNALGTLTCPWGYFFSTTNVNGQQDGCH